MRSGVHGGAFFLLFGVVFIGIGVVNAVYSFKNATGENRYSDFDIVDSHEEPDPLNERFGRQPDAAPPEAGEAGNFAYCPYCGAKLGEGFTFCGKCGKMKIGLQFAMPAELHALPGAKDWTPFETVSSIPFYEAEPGIIACAGGVSKVNAAMAAEILCLKYGVDLILNAGVMPDGSAHRQSGGAG